MSGVLVVGAAGLIGRSVLAEAERSGVAAVSELGGAKRGDRTMLDALLPAADALETAAQHDLGPAQAWAQTAEAATRGAEATAGMKPRFGRASYLGNRALGVSDAGAVAVSIWLGAIAGQTERDIELSSDEGQLPG